MLTSQLVHELPYRYSLLLGSMERMLHGSKEQLLRAEERAKFMLERSASGQDNCGVPVAPSDPNPIQSILAVGASEMDEEVEHDSDLPLRVALTLKSIGEMEVWEEGLGLDTLLPIPLETCQVGDNRRLSRPASLDIGLKSPGAVVASQILSFSVEPPAAPSDVGDEAPPPQTSRSEHVEDRVQDVRSGSTLQSLLPARFRSLAARRDGDDCNTDYFIVPAQESPSADMILPFVSPSGSDSTDGEKIGKGEQKPAQTVPPPLNSALTAVLEGIGRVMPGGGTKASPPPASTLPPPETAVPWLSVDDTASQVRYIALQV